EDIKKVKDAQEALKKAQQENNLDDMKQKRDDLNKLVQDMTVKLYENAQKNQQAQGGAASGAATGATQGGTGKKSDDDTINGDYKDVSDDDKK
ncbi:MAG TPA: molecular chaperone DnaK, partial [Lactobacillus sp.]|nr:molecular chaperone DnaK [Lactobacillus sp.]